MFFYEEDKISAFLLHEASIKLMRRFCELIRNKFVSYAPYPNDEPRVLRIVFELLSEQRDVLVDGAGLM